MPIFGDDMDLGGSGILTAFLPLLIVSLYTSSVLTGSIPHMVLVTDVTTWGLVRGRFVAGSILALGLV